MKKVELAPDRLMYPRPTLLVGSNVDGKANFMAVGGGGVANAGPPMIAVPIRHHQYTLKGILQNMTFSVNTPSVDLIKETDYCGIVSGANIDKSKVCGFNVFYGKLKTAPLIEQCPLNHVSAAGSGFISTPADISCCAVRLGLAPASIRA